MVLATTCAAKAFIHQSYNCLMYIIILGGGIGGLATALSLHAAGIACKVYEATSEIKPLGVGINVLPHSVRELTELGLLPKLDATGIRTEELVYATKRGEIIWREPRGKFAGYHWPQFSIHRGDLQMLLYDAVVERLGRDAVVTGHRAIEVTQNGARATAHFVDAAGQHLPSASADLVIAADGIHSAVRTQFFPDEGPPVWSRRILWRGTTVAKPFLTGASMMLAGYAWKKWVCYPIRQLESDNGEPRQLINWIAELTFDSTSIHAPEDWNRLGKLEDFMPDFEKWNFGWMHVGKMIREAQAVYEYPMSDRNPAPTWVKGRCALLGDAAHAMYPIGSNGASQAILDARKLAFELATQPTVETALAAYEAERLPATAKLLELTRAEGPDAVMQRVEERAPDGFDDLEKVLPLAEREAIAARYKQAAGFDMQTLNTKPSLTPAHRAH
jgi:2-polyprenyl-6-methoxyphenol hydroxylase-like FAD-dependent oxidoreductase